MEPFSPKALVLATLLSTALAVRGIKKRNLTKHGAIAGVCVGFILVATGLRGLILFYFYQLGSWATKIGHVIKEGKDATISDHTARGATQVLCVSLTPVLLSMLHVIQCGAEQPIDFSSIINNDNDNEEQSTIISTTFASTLSCAILAHHATCLADTLASEFGMLSSEHPVLITNLRKVPPGTNGGITWVGTGSSVLGGTIIGLLTVAMDGISGLQPLYNHYAGNMILFGACCGFLGSMIDSFLGATVQATYYDVDEKRIYHASSKHRPTTAKLLCGKNILTNEQVNFVSALITSIISGWIIAPWIFWNDIEQSPPLTTLTN